MAVDILEFLDAIYGEAEGWADIVTMDPETQVPSSEMFRQYPTDRAYLAKYCALRADEDVYISVALFSNKHRTKEDRRAVANAVWADADTCDPDNFKITPSVVVETSPGRWHCWWVLDSPVEAQEAAGVAQSIAYAHREQGADLGWQVSKILRVPGTTNTKYDEPFTVTVEYTGVLYTLDELRDAYPATGMNTEVVTLDADVPELLTTSQLIDLETRVVRGMEWENLYVDTPPKDADWSERLFRLQFDLFRAGCTPQEIFTLSKNAACNKFERDHRPDSDLWKTVQNAYRKYMATTEGIEVGSTHVPSLVSVPDFLTSEEKVALPETFVDRYVKWVRTRTDAAETYQRSLGFLLLSCIFGSRAYLPESYGPQNLNLWCFLLGDTTRTRKSTAKNLFLRVLHLYEINALRGDRIDIGSDITKEGLGKILGDRNGLVSLFQTDEIAGALREWYGKNYQIGTIQYLTSLYDGDVPVVLRAGKDAGQTKRAKTVFELLGVGIRDDVARTLNKNDFQSGFLARALWSVADPPPRKKGADNWPDEIEMAHDDADIARIVVDLMRRANKFDMDKRVPIRIDDEALARYNYWTELVRTHSEGLGDGTLEGAVGRFFHSVRRAAALLALYDGKTTISKKHLLPAIAQGQLWYQDLLRMFNEVSASDFERLLNDVEHFISTGTGGGRTDASVRRKFAFLRPPEINDVLTSLTRQGRIRANGATAWQALSG